MESLTEFYQRKFGWIPGKLQNAIGHFNIFRLEPFVAGKPTIIPYQRCDFYKIMLVKGNSKVHYADKIVEIKNQALSFSNPLIPYKWEHLDRIRDGVYCLFDSSFFHEFGQSSHYEVFQPTGDHVFELTDEQVDVVSNIFDQIETEFLSDYKYKFDLVRNYIFELIHFALKMKPQTLEDDLMY